MLVRQEDEDKESEESVQTPKNPPQPLSMPRHLRMKLKGNKPILAYLSYYTRTLGGANTAFSSSYAVQPNLDSSFASWAATFDEMKVLQAEVHWKVNVVAAATVAPTQSPATIMVYDPTNQTPLASVNAGMQYEKFQLCSNAFVPATANQVWPLPFTKTGFWLFKAKMPSGTQSSAATSTLSTGQWRPTDDANNYVWGTFQSYTSQGGTTCQLQTEAFVRMVVEFRVRR